MRKHSKNIFTVAIFLSVMFSFSQRKAKDTLDTGVIDVVKPYKPTITDAFKVKDVPVLEDETTETKKKIIYNIFSFPVASTFKPAKGSAANVEKKKAINLFDNYVSLGGGNYTNILGDAYINHAINKNESIGAYVSHHSSQGGIKEVAFNDAFSKSGIHLDYSKDLKKLSWQSELGFKHQMFNWYGVPESFETQAKLDSIDVKHAFINWYVGSNFNFDDAHLDTGRVFFRRFSDNQSSAENRFIAEAKVDFPINDLEFFTQVKFDYLGGSFNRNYYSNTALNYGNIRVGLSPTYQLVEDAYSINIGASLNYFMDIESNENKFYLYPNIDANYTFVDEVLTAYGGVTGDLTLNTYHDFANENPFVSPTLTITPTNQAYNVYLGLKGKLSRNISYNVNGRYFKDKNKALYKTNPVIGPFIEQDYNYGNSFQVVYDDVDVINISGEIGVDVTRKFSLMLKASYFNFSTSREGEAWNLPDIEGTLFADYQINERWFTGANFLFVGQREDQLSIENILLSTREFTSVNLNGFFDANAHLGYHISDRISTFIKVNNIANTSYQKWQSLPVQGIQFLVGAVYKFNY